MALSLFPFPAVRSSQKELIEAVRKAVQEESCLIAHAPTGLGKTAAALVPAVEFALENNLKVFFLTSRQTQHRLAIATLQAMHEISPTFIALDMIGKQTMCLQEASTRLQSGEFSEYCAQVKKDNLCDFYGGTFKKGALTKEATATIDSLKGAVASESIVHESEKCKHCPYEIALQVGKKARVIVADYYHLFHPSIRDAFLAKINASIEESIIIIDEAHNLPDRMRNVLTDMTSSISLSFAIKEAEKFGFDELRERIESFLSCIERLSKNLENREEMLLSKEDILSIFEGEDDLYRVIGELDEAGSLIVEKQQKSHVLRLSHFLSLWLGPDKGFVRILSIKQGKRQPYIQVSYRCLDPSLAAGDVINNAHAAILISGTLVPTDMYRDLLGIKNAREREFPNPFPKTNRLNLIIPGATTKFSQRNDEQFKRLAAISAYIANEVPGNTAIFFPSYDIRDKVNWYFEKICKKTTMLEIPNMQKEEKAELIDRFSSYAKVGAVLLAASSGSFGEGIDLPGDLLKAVVIIGLPLQRPTLEVQALINYFDEKYERGWEYGYVLPAITKTLQNAGRCIRSETDKGIIAFVDERYLWPRYKACFPEDMEPVVSRDFVEEIRTFFSISTS
ncbi:MAG: DNA excision repair protein ERCC-2 [archaeon GW2011_AR4]|nr:MAG: DNA excision repair protein ERCC-2 [archaeon GW2011_AR4]